MGTKVQNSVLATLGVPSCFLEKQDPPSFLDFTIKRKDCKDIPILKGKQSSLYKLFGTSDNNKAYKSGMLIFVLTMEGPEDIIIQTSVDMIRNQISRSNAAKFSVINVADIPQRYERDTEGGNVGRIWWKQYKKKDCVVLYNNDSDISDSCRTQVLKDAIFSNRDATRIVCLTGRDPIEYIRTSLRATPQGLLIIDPKETSDRWWCGV